MKFTLSRHRIYFDLQRIAAHARPCKATHDADVTLFIPAVDRKNLLAKIFLQVFLGYLYSFCLLLQNLSGCLPADLADPAFQLTHPASRV